MTKYVIRDRVKVVEQRAARRWLRGLGKDAEFEERSDGWWLTLTETRLSLQLGYDEPGLRADQRVRLTIELDE